MQEEEIEKYLKAGEIARKVKRESRRWIEPGRSLLQICEKIEERIIELGGSPAFPCNIGVNDIAAHFTPPPFHVDVIPSVGLVKVDFGVHVDGYIVDTAFTIPFSKRYVDIVETSEESLRRASRILKVGVKISQIGELIENFVKSRGYRVIRNLTGHQIDRFNLHTGLSIPNLKTLTLDKLGEDTVVAIEPFVTFIEGFGEVCDLNKTYIYRFKHLSTYFKGEFGNLQRALQNQFKTLPFCERWVLKKLGESGRDNFVKMLEYARKQLVLYSVLVERNRIEVAQAEDTFLIQKDSVINLTCEDG
ncbi:MAG: type II methionyl aminopeptidase [Thermoproteota archaeon]